MHLLNSSPQVLYQVQYSDSAEPQELEISILTTACNLCKAKLLAHIGMQDVVFTSLSQQALQSQMIHNFMQSFKQTSSQCIATSVECATHAHIHYGVHLQLTASVSVSSCLLGFFLLTCKASAM